MAVPAPRARSAPSAAASRSRLLLLLADPRRVLLVTAALVAFAACVDVLHDPDLWWHLRLGRWILDNHTVPHTELFSFTAAGAPMTAHEWGSEVLFALLRRAGGLLLVAVVMGLVAWSGLLALGLRARSRGAGLVAVSVALLLGARAAQPVLGTRPQVITVALICWTLLIAERHLARGTRWIWALPPIVLLWANLHGGVVLGLAALLLLLGLEVIRVWLRRPGVASVARLRSLAGALLLAAAAGCLNPNGPGLYRYSLTTSASERLKPITEWHSPDFSDPSNIGLLLLIVSFALLIALGGRLSLRDLGMSVVGFAAALVAVRNTSLAVALALPAWASLLGQVIANVSARVSARREPESSPRPPRLGAQPLVAACAVLALGASVIAITIARAANDASAQGIATTYPACAAQALQGRQQDLVAPYFHSGYLIDRLWPRTHVFLYGESASLGLQTFTDYQRIYAGTPDSLQLLRSHHATAVLTPNGALHDALADSAEWHQVLTDPTGLTLFTTAAQPPATC